MLQVVDVPSMEVICRWAGHMPGTPVLEMLPVHGCCLSISHGQALLSSVGGAPRLSYLDKVSQGPSGRGKKDGGERRER